jgi:hypothetical protein
MAISSKRFTLSTAVYQDVSEGAESCGIYLQLVSQKNNGVRLVLGTALPAVDSVHYQAFRAPQNSAEELFIDLQDLEATDRVYLRAENNFADITVLRK